MSLRRFHYQTSLALALCLCLASIVQAGLFPVSIESGSRITVTGDKLDYDLFIPQAGLGLPEPPYPVVILTHGFARNKKFHRKNAQYMAERGIAVLTPNMSGLLGGESAQLKNIDNTADHVKWLITRSETSEDALYHLINPNAIGLAGHSAGGAVSFEAAVQAQTSDFPVAALCLLDAVPWTRTEHRAPELQEPGFCSLRSEPTPCNGNGSVLELLKALSLPSTDVRIVDGTHVDPENPTDFWGPLFCGGTSPACRAIYQRLMYLFFQDAFQMESVEEPAETYADGLETYHRAGRIAVEISPFIFPSFLP